MPARLTTAQRHAGKNEVRPAGRARGAQRLPQVALAARYIDSRLRQQRSRTAIALLQHGEWQVPQFDELLVAET
ncbi:hypothetical protein SDC9_158360 [bioreactor metagenome]|uniref:Uncharacterized protein n=1 Tax=bioreactor metagenome TaxID=1076179 RepID=A0A645FCJ0_9ZZZZ